MVATLLQAGSLALLVLASFSACSSDRQERSRSTQATGGAGNASGTGAQSPGGNGGAASGAAGTSGDGGTAGTSGDGGTAGAAGDAGTASDASSAGSSGGNPADASSAGGTSGSGGVGGADGTGGSACCPTGDCICRGPAPTGLTSGKGPFAATSVRSPSGNIFYPTDAEPPFASLAMIAVVTSATPELAAWGQFYASHGIVMLLVLGTSSDQPSAHATKLLEALKQLEAENSRADSPLRGKLSDRFGVAGYSIAAGGTTLASSSAPKLRSSMTLGVWGGNGSGIQVPTLLLCGENDPVAPCSMSESVYSAIPEATPKMMVSIAGVNHFSWFGPKDAGGGISGEVALAFQKVFLEGDERYRPLLLQSRGTVTTTIQ
jgi:pimeloyl-ACP methyl ester carboxylesterase